MNVWRDALYALPWLLGLTLLLATVSDAVHARRPGLGLRALLGTGGRASVVDAGLALFTLGLLLSADAWWERIVWGLFTAFYAGSLAWRLRQRSASPNNEGALAATLASVGATPVGSCPAPVTRGGAPANPPVFDDATPPMPTREDRARALGIVRWVEPIIVAAVAPALWFPTQSPPLTIASLVLLGAMWLTTSLLRRRFWPAAPWNAALALLVFMAAVGTACSAVWELTLPKVTGLVLGLAVYRAMIVFARDRRALLLALAAMVILALGFAAMGLLFGELRADKIPFVAALRVRIPQIDRALPNTQGGRVSTNQLGGTLLYLLPLLVALLLVWRRPAGLARREWRVWVALAALGAGALAAALLLTQSRGAWLGMAAGVASLVGLRWRWGRWALLAGGLALVVGAWRFWPEIDAQLTRNPATVGLASPGTLLWRVEVWERTIGYLGDVPFTGYGLGAFRAVDTLFYGPGIVAAGDGSVFDVGVPHAHNVFLQMGFDTGIPGLLAYVAIILLAARECANLVRRASPLYATLGMGGLATLVASHVYGVVDVVALGAKPGVLWWGLLAFIVALRYVAETERSKDMVP